MLEVFLHVWLDLVRNYTMSGFIGTNSFIVANFPEGVPGHLRALSTRNFGHTH